MTNVYLDNSATTRCLPQVVEAVTEVMLETYGNPSSLHKMGVEAEKLLKKARRQVASVLRVEDREIFFTSGGTEANNWALWGTANQRAGRGRHVVTTTIEHSSILESAKRLQEDGFTVSFLEVNQEGLVDPEQLQQILTEETILVSIMSVNNEVGSVQPLRELSRVIRSRAPQAVFHVDAVQSFGKLQLYPKELGIDLLSLSGHKIHGPKGVGALYIRRDVQVKPFLIGGEQENCFRAGTENVPGIVGLGKAAEIAGEKLAANDRKLYHLNRKLREGLANIPGAHINGPKSPDAAAPHIINMWFEGVDRGEVLLHSLESEGIYVSTGSACHSRREEASHVLKAMGLSGEALTGAIRVSLSYLNNEQEIDYFLEKLTDVVSELRELGS
ncbi:MAG: cysteine desulfurase [Thermoanaerobacteraceae bacterium]|nr:cysteine desulfurase [Thermoanaerobacteraceae bacterium]